MKYAKDPQVEHQRFGVTTVQSSRPNEPPYPVSQQSPNTGGDFADPCACSFMITFPPLHLQSLRPSREYVGINRTKSDWRHSRKDSRCTPSPLAFVTSSSMPSHVQLFGNIWDPSRVTLESSFPDFVLNPAITRKTSRKPNNSDPTIRGTGVERRGLPASILGLPPAETSLGGLHPLRRSPTVHNGSKDGRERNRTWRLLPRPEGL